MQKFDVQIALERVQEARAAWGSANRDFQSAVDKIMGRLLHEAARNFMSVDEVVKASGMTRHRVRELMRKNNLNPRDGKRMLAKSAAKALNENAELLGINPFEMDLMSPLAYLPMGQELRQALTDKTTSKVTELPDDEPDPTLTLDWTRAWLLQAAPDFDRTEFMDHVERVVKAAL